MANGWESVVAEVVALQSSPGDWRPGPGFQWFPKQWLGDDVVLMMSIPARGYHHHLIQMAWQQDPPCSLPDDQLILRGWCGHPTDWADLWQQISRAWRLLDGRWWQVGLCRAYLEQMRLRVIRRGNGKKGGRPSVLVTEEPPATEVEATASGAKAGAFQRTSTSSASASAPALPSSSGLDREPSTGPLGEVGDCGEASSPPPDPGLLDFECVGDPKTWTLSRRALADFQDAFPNLDVMAECRRARAWLRSNPGRRKTATGMRRFLNNWLAKSTNQPRLAARHDVSRGRGREVDAQLDDWAKESA
jgi:hypothetical protein